MGRRHPPPILHIMPTLVPRLSISQGNIYCTITKHTLMIPIGRQPYDLLLRNAHHAAPISGLILLFNTKLLN